MKIICDAYKNEFWEWKKSKKIVPKTFNVLKTRIKRLKNIDSLHKIPFYNELSIEKISKTFTRYARSYRIEIIDSKDPLVSQILKICIKTY